MNEELIEKKILKLTLEELNEAYNICKIEGEKVNSPTYTVIMGRDPLIINNTLMKAYKLSDNEIEIVLKLKFEFDYELGRKGAWYCISNIEVIDLD